MVLGARRLARVGIEDEAPSPGNQLGRILPPPLRSGRIFLVEQSYGDFGVNEVTGHRNSAPSKERPPQLKNFGRSGQNPDATPMLLSRLRCGKPETNPRIANPFWRFSDRAACDRDVHVGDADTHIESTQRIGRGLYACRKPSSWAKAQDDDRGEGFRPYFKFPQNRWIRPHASSSTSSLVA